MTSPHLRTNIYIAGGAQWKASGWSTATKTSSILRFIKNSFHIKWDRDFSDKRSKVLTTIWDDRAKIPVCKASFVPTTRAGHISYRQPHFQRSHVILPPWGSEFFENLWLWAIDQRLSQKWSLAISAGSLITGWDDRHRSAQTRSVHRQHTAIGQRRTVPQWRTRRRMDHSMHWLGVPQFLTTDRGPVATLRTIFWDDVRTLFEVSGLAPSLCPQGALRPAAAGHSCSHQLKTRTCSLGYCSSFRTSLSKPLKCFLKCADIRALKQLTWVLYNVMLLKPTPFCEVYSLKSLQTHWSCEGDIKIGLH